MNLVEAVALIRRCDTYGCDARATVFWRHKKFCGDCAGTIDAVRLDQGFAAMEWEDEPADG